MPDAPQPPKSKAIAYAEIDLGVHRPLTITDQARATIIALNDQLKLQRSIRRIWEEQIADREMELTADEQGKHHDMSVAAMERHLKPILHTDNFLREARAKLRDALLEIDSIEDAKRVAEMDTKVAAARMQELGGYFQYLAAVKSSGATRETSHKGDST